MSDFAAAMPLLARHEGVWDGTYSYFNAQNEKIDEHASRLLCRITGDRQVPYHQTNHYTWPDGRTEVRDFPATYRDGRIWWDNELIQGWAAEVPLDEYNRTMMLYWQRTGDPSLYLLRADPDFRLRPASLPHLALDPQWPARKPAPRSRRPS